MLVAILVHNGVSDWQLHVFKQHQLGLAIIVHIDISDLLSAGLQRCHTTIRVESLHSKQNVASRTSHLHVFNAVYKRRTDILGVR